MIIKAHVDIEGVLLRHGRSEPKGLKNNGPIVAQTHIFLATITLISTT